MGRIIAFLYGAVSYVVFFLTFLYAIGFVGNLVVPKSIDSGTQGAMGAAILINVVLLLVFAGQHNVMARPEFKERWTKIVPKQVERSTFVLFSSLALILMFWQWRPMLGVVWSVDNSIAAAGLTGLSLAGWGLVLASTFLINHFDLFGLRQVFLYLRGQEYTDLGFRMPLFYKLVRHPLLLGFMIAFWATPTMTTGHLLFAVVTTAWMLFSIQLEERDLMRFLPDQYPAYREQVPMLIPGLKRRTAGRPSIRASEKDPVPKTT